MSISCTVSPSRVFKNALLLLLLFVGGCARFTAFTDPELTSYCPPVGMLSDATEVTQFLKGQAATSAHMTAHGRLVDFSGTCQVDRDGLNAGQRLTIALDLTFVSTRGPAANSQGARYTYLLALLNAEGKVISKKIYTITIPWLEGISTTTKVASVKKFIIPSFDENYRIVTGFQLSKKQIEFNRRRSARR